MSHTKKKKKNKGKRYALSSTHVNDVREKHLAHSEATRKRFRQRHQKRTLWGGCNEYVDDDLVSRILVKWPFTELLAHSRLFVLLLNRRIPMPLQSPLPDHVSSLVYFRHPSEYYETLFADYTNVMCTTSQSLSFRAYYTLVYKEATTMATVEERAYHVARLRACFMVALTYEPRIRRFVFSNHDIHYEHLHTHPPPLQKTAHFIERVRDGVDAFLSSNVDYEAETFSATVSSLWLMEYMFLLQ